MICLGLKYSSGPLPVLPDEDDLTTESSDPSEVGRREAVRLSGIILNLLILFNAACV